ncbi:uncharacterized protein NMK_3658 [Novimethylophilus kurashikiensis]|uniref:Uncharacterized protein n=1 Tax=Novimethylophilus kurashikiensis TaxID=1825523 RepID=A0A2R5FK26_9PROT|nr:hypothetical protein [Novimethylophilus kurashikiensis]GBG16034.1 uncharacterized protein NMK_3658 [Novimethylophilus kurashikiensis]
MLESEAIETIFRRLPLLENQALTKMFLQSAIDQIMILAKAGAMDIPNRYTSIAEAPTQKELDAIAKQAKKLLSQLKYAHQTTILALADQGFWRIDADLECLLKTLSNQASQAKVGQVSTATTGGRPENRKAHYLARVLAHYYYKLTGKKPSRSSSAKHPHGYINLVESMFELLAIDPANSDHYARLAIREFNASISHTENPDGENFPNLVEVSA